MSALSPPNDPRRAGRAVNGFSLRNTLEAMHQIATPKQYATLLTAAGLERYVTSPPAPTPDIAATDEEFSRLFAQIYKMLGENIMRTMMRNWGVALGPIIESSDLVAAADKDIKHVKPADRFKWAVEKSAEITDVFWAPVDITEDAHYYRLHMVRCPICTQIQGAHDPICTNAVAIYAVLMEHFTGTKTAVREIECAAKGDPACVYGITKPGVL